jgi:Trk-type K+ transport system membrane component
VDTMSLLVGAALGGVAVGSLYEIIIRKRMNRLMRIMSRAHTVEVSIADISKRIEELKNKKGGDEK